MELQVEIVSRETIRPATPTPPHLKCHILSLLDQLTPLVYGLKIDCYAPPNNGHIYKDHAETVTHLKHSLSRALSVYYPIAGRLTSDESSIDCNDAGIPFVEARCEFPLSLFLHAPNRVDMAWRFLPTIIPPVGDLHHQTSISKSRPSLLVTEMVPFAVQVSFFSCGGVIIGSKQLNKIFDAPSGGLFMNSWSDYYSAEGGVDQGNNMDVNVINKPPDFAFATSLFPPRTWATVTPPGPPIMVCASDGIQEDGPCILKAFEFSPHSLLTLQAKARSDYIPNPTRTEAVSGFIWKNVMTAAAANTAKNAIMCGPSVVTHAVNMRPRTRPKVSPKVFGNMIIHAIAYYKGKDDNQYNEASAVPELPGLVAEVSRAFAEVKDPKFLGKLQGVEGGEVIRKYKQKLADLKNDSATTSFYKFVSWSWISGLNTEFGFGIHMWSGLCGGRMSSLFRNLIVLIDEPNGGIQASIILDEKEMHYLQFDPDFLSFASLVGSPSHLSKM